jgi:hypothetical protein
LETRASRIDFDLLLFRAGTAERVHVLLSANVFVAVVRAVAIAAAAARTVCVRASRRENVMPHLLHRALVEEGGWTFHRVDELALASGDEIHAYGRDETIAEVERKAPPGAKIRGHGTGVGLAFVDPGEPSAAEALSWDVVAFDQRGCLSPRWVFVDGPPDRAGAFAAALAKELEKRAAEVPRGLLSEEERQGAALYARTLRAVGQVSISAEFVVGFDPAPRALVLPPPGRHIHVIPVGADVELEAILRPWSSVVTCVGYAGARRHSSLATTLRNLTIGARWCPLGTMQSPPLDGPVDLRGVL